ncbi:MAG: nuclear transport factor 2 family protein [Actinobacteria bacterium]|jgi:ketosteroid isomerase-like protein|nr:MAG: nuclear transport factor 2 family protein [Actinomycetota bacterium]
MDERSMYRLAEVFLEAWNTQDVDRTAACYTEDAIYVDPNTRGAVKGSEAFRRYLAKLFAAWQMHWSLREAFLFAGGNGCGVLWHASIRRTGDGREVEFDGMDLVMVRDDLIERNEVYFDRAALLPLLEASGP